MTTIIVMILTVAVALLIFWLYYAVNKLYQDDEAELLLGLDRAQLSLHAQLDEEEIGSYKLRSVSQQTHHG